MPKELWEEAVSLARSDGVAPVANRIGLDYKSLARRVAGAGVQVSDPDEGVPRGAAPREAGQEDVRSPVSAPDGFLSLTGAELVGARPDLSKGTEVEFSGADGAVLTIRLPSGQAVDVLGLAEAFWGRRL